MKKVVKYLCFSILSLGATTACQPTQEVFAERKSKDNSADIRAYLAANKLTADSTIDGLYYIVKATKPNPQLPVVGDEVTLSYVARRLDGYLLDSSYSAYPYKFIHVPYSNVPTQRFTPVPSLDDLMAPTAGKIHEGDKVTLFVPWSLRNGTTASLFAPLYIPLRYDLQILNIRSENEQIIDYINDNKIIPDEINPNGIRFKKLVSRPDSTAIKVGDEVKVTYTGRLASSGLQFDTGTLTVTVTDTAATAAAGNVVRGFNSGIFRLKYGEKGIIIFPSSMGYGATGSNQKIPAYAPLVFEIEAQRK